METDTTKPRIYVRSQKKAIARTMRLIEDFNLLVESGVRIESLRLVLQELRLADHLPKLEAAMMESREALNRAKWLYGSMAL